MPSFFELGSLKSSVTQCPEGLSPFAWRMMQAEDRRTARKNQLLISLLIVTLVPTFSILDYFAYPEFFLPFLYLRLACVAGALAAYGVIQTPFGKRYYRAFTVLLPLIPAFFISLMILIAQDPGTPYYAGLTLCIVAIGFVFHWTYMEAFIATVTIACMYFVASSPAILNGMDSRTAAGFVNNSIFIAAKGVVIVLGCIAHQRSRIANFIVRDRSRQQQIALRAQKREIESTLEELKETEGKLIQSEKMASLGQLSAGVIHEIGNPLNYSNQALFMLRRLLKGEEQNLAAQEAMDDIQESMDRMKDIVKELREFSHKSSEVKIEYPILDSMQVALRMMGKEITDLNVVVSCEVDPDLRIDGVKNQVTQVFINLVHNSIHAVASVEDEELRLIKVSSRETAENVEIVIWDNGPGMDDETRKRIFDPFFTSKQVGEGTGLGLSICYRIVEAHSGSLQVDSKVGEFTEFVVTLPRVASKANPSENHHSYLNKQSTHEKSVR